MNGIDPNGLAPVEHYLREWVFGSQNWDEAFGKARKQKMGPFDPNDNYNRTAAEHYIFGQALGNGRMGPAMQGIYWFRRLLGDCLARHQDSWLISQIISS